MDASESWGCGAIFDKKWLQWQWPLSWAPLGIKVKELIPILLSYAIWGPIFAKHTILFKCDNSSMVAAVNKGSSKEVMVMHLLRYLWFFVAYYDIVVVAKHIPGVINSSADHLSRNHMSLFFSSNPQADPAPTPLPLALLSIISTQTRTGHHQPLRSSSQILHQWSCPLYP